MWTLQIKVMINIQELIIHLEKKITEYRYHQKRTGKAKAEIRAGREVLLAMKTAVRFEVGKALSDCRREMVEGMVKMSQHYEEELMRQRRMREEEVMELRGEIERQYKVMANMRKEVEDLEELMMLQNIGNGSPNNQEEELAKEAESKIEELAQAPTINGLEIIEEEDTDRTILSSARSIRDDRRISQDNFIRIQEKEQLNEEVDLPFRKKETTEFLLESFPVSSNNSFSKRQSYLEQSQQSQQSSICRLEQLLEASAFSKRQPTSNFDHEQEQTSQYESLPISMQGYYGKMPTDEDQEEPNPWQGRLCSQGELRDITNGKDSQHERKAKSRMFIEDFRKTFYLPLSTASRKSSTRQQKPVQREGKGDSQKMISDMLRDIDNNNKFTVGSRRHELRYQGERSKDGSRHGHGVLYYQNGLCYQGEFRNNQRHGYGILRFNNIEVYRGEWLADELSGQGRIRNAAAVNRKKSQPYNSPLLKWVTYCGYFRNNRFQGQGTLVLQGAEKFLGRFICGTACGEGTLYRKNGEIETGIWRSNQLVEKF